MRLLVLSAAIAATVMVALPASTPASAEIVVRGGGDGIVVRDRDHDRRDWGRSHRRGDWRRSHAECREVRVRTRTPSGRIVYRMQRSCN